MKLFHLCCQVGYSVSYLLLVKAGLGRFNIQVMEEGKNQTTFFPDIWKPDGKLSLREILSSLTVFPVLLQGL